MLLSDKRKIFAQNRIYPVITPEFCAGRSVPEVAFEILSGGARVFQLRAKTLPDRELFDLACELQLLAEKFSALLIIDDRVDIALLSGAGGVHLGQDDLPAAEVKKLFPELFVGVSTHNLPEIKDALASGCDYLNIGPIFPTQTKSVQYPAVGVETLKKLIPEVTIPFSVMGGIKAPHIRKLRQAGARHIAMVTEITQAANIRQKVQELIALD